MSLELEGFMKFPRQIYLLLLMLQGSYLFAQEQVSGKITDILEAGIVDFPNQDASKYANPDMDDLTIWNNTIEALVEGKYSESASFAESIAYKLIKVDDNSSGHNKVYYLLRRQENSENYWGTYVFNETPNSPMLVIQSPHASADTNTGSQGIFTFEDTGAKALFINGTHRCSSSVFSECSGTTSVCSANSESYKISDVAHNVDSPFHVATKLLNDKVESLVFIQLHGFAKKESDPYVIMSNGTRETPENDPIVAIRDELSKIDKTLTFRIAHLNSSWTRLVGFNNTQGRYINQSSDPCESSATQTNGQFIHIEQEKTKLREDKTKWAKLSTALFRVFGDDVIASSDTPFGQQPYSVSPNPFSTGLEVTGPIGKDVTIRICDVFGREIIFNKYAYNQKIDTQAFICASGIYYCSVIEHGRVVLTQKILKR